MTIVCVSALNECDWNCTLTTRANVRIHGRFGVINVEILPTKVTLFWFFTMHALKACKS